MTVCLKLITFSGGEVSHLKVTSEQKSLMEESVGVIDRGIHKVSSDRHFYIAALVVFISVFFYTIDLELHHPSITIPVTS